MSSRPMTAARSVESLERFLRSDDDNPWIDWPGGECPVPDGTLVDVSLRNGLETDGYAQVWRWTHSDINDWMNRPTDIVAYRISK